MSTDNEFQQFDDLFADWSTEYTPAPKFEAENDLHQFFHDCETFDWYYNYSDDQRVWTRGNREAASLKSRSNKNNSTLSIYNAWSEHMFSGPEYGTEKTPRPKWEDYRA